MTAPLLSVRNLRVRFDGDRGVVEAVAGVSFDVERGETVCVVGESGAGKTVTAESITRLLPEPPARLDGEVLIDGADALSMSDRELRRVRGGTVAHVFQDPGAALNPVYSVGWQIREAIDLHCDPGVAARDRAIELLDRVGVPNAPARVDDYPHEFSGGQQGRIALAMALSGEPDLLVADEPTAALDAPTRLSILRLLSTLQTEFGLGILLVTHDLGVVAEVADRVVVLHDGEIAEMGDVYEVFESPAHPYTRSLLDSHPGRDRRWTGDGDTASDEGRGPGGSTASDEERGPGDGAGDR